MLVFAATQDDVPPTWKGIISKDGGFRVAMPAAPTEKKQLVKTATGQLQVMLLIAEGRNESLFVVGYADFPEAELKKGAIEKRLDQARDRAVENARGKLRSEKAIDLAGTPGREIAIEKDGVLVARLRIYLVGRRLYQVMVLGSGPVLGSKDVGIFLGSFRLNK